MNSTNDEIYIQMNDLNLNENHESNEIYIQMNDLKLNESNESNESNEVYIQINEICCICLDESEKLDFILDCCHNQIHSKCIEAWYTYDNCISCPLCRYSYPKNEEIRQEIDQRRIKPLIYLFVYIMICILLRYNK